MEFNEMIAKIIALSKQDQILIERQAQKGPFIYHHYSYEEFQALINAN